MSFDEFLEQKGRPRPKPRPRPSTPTAEPNSVPKPRPSTPDDVIIISDDESQQSPSLDQRQHHFLNTQLLTARKLRDQELVKNWDRLCAQIVTELPHYDSARRPNIQHLNALSRGKQIVLLTRV